MTKNQENYLMMTKPRFLTYTLGDPGFQPIFWIIDYMIVLLPRSVRAFLTPPHAFVSKDGNLIKELVRAIVEYW